MSDIGRQYQSHVVLFGNILDTSLEIRESTVIKQRQRYWSAAHCLCDTAKLEDTDGLGQVYEAHAMCSRMCLSRSYAPQDSHKEATCQPNGRDFRKEESEEDDIVAGRRLVPASSRASIRHYDSDTIEHSPMTELYLYSTDNIDRDAASFIRP